MSKQLAMSIAISVTAMSAFVVSAATSPSAVMTSEHKDGAGAGAAAPSVFSMS